MANFNPLSSSVSFDDLLKANKQQFDRIFSAQTEELGVLGWIGLVGLVCGVVLLSLRGDISKLNRPAIGFALATAITIVAYSIVDGVGGRAAHITFVIPP